MKVVIYETNAGHYIVSARGRRLPGIYANLTTARWSYQFSRTTLEQLSKRWNPITSENLREARKHGC